MIIYESEHDYWINMYPVDWPGNNVSNSNLDDSISNGD